jgi:RNA polymerase sigma factor (sigma-70 family)
MGKLKRSSVFAREAVEDAMAHQYTNMTLAPPDMAEMAALYQQYASALLAYLLRRVPDEEDAEDILVEVFLAALENEQFSRLPEKAQLAWLWRVTRNKTVDAYRRSTRRRTRNVTLESVIEHALGDDGAEPEHSALRQEEYDILQGHLQTLTPLQQEVLQMRFGQDMRCSEIAARMGKREGAIKVMLSRTLNLLKNIYKA